MPAKVYLFFRPWDPQVTNENMMALNLYRLCTTMNMKVPAAALTSATVMPIITMLGSRAIDVAPITTTAVPNTISGFRAMPPIWNMQITPISGRRKM